MTHETPTEPTDAVHVPTGADYVSDRAFADFPISEEVLQGIHDLGYRTATPVQADSIEPSLAGRDMIVRAKTGTGKTAAFCIPIVERTEAGARQPRAIVLAPTRELAQQIAEECSAIAAHKDVSVAVLVGGLAMGPQTKALEEGASIIVGTPGRILDHYRNGRLELKGIRTAVLDEADEMLSMGFFEDVSAILDACPDDRQVLLFSATIDPELQRLVNRYTRDPEEIMLSTDADRVEGIDHVLYEMPPGFHKVRALLYLLDVEDPQSAIIFCNTREDAATVAAFLDRQGLDVQLLSGELPQGQRNKVMQMVKAGAVRFLASTDVAARGIDISDLSHVINYALPQDPPVYLHRIGRTGRIGKKGTAISLVGATDLSTRKILQNRHGIDFEVREFPDPDTCVQRRVTRQAESIRDAMGTMVFESYLPTVKALLEREDGEMLLAAALRAFFQWDRVRRAELAGVPSEPERRDRGDRDRDRGDRGDRGDRKGGKGRKGDKRDKRGRGDERPERRERSAAPSTEDLDALLVSDDTGAQAPPSDAAGKKKRRRRRGKKSEGGSEGSTETASAPLDDLDSLLSAD